MTTCEKIKSVTGLDFFCERLIDWQIVSQEPLPEDFIREFQDKVDWAYISVFQNLSENFIREFSNHMDWIWISKYQNLSENLIRDFKDCVNWGFISEKQKLSEDFIREFSDRVNWIHISKYQRLSEPFIQEFENKVDWDFISMFQKLSEDFIHKYNKKVNWHCISEYQKLSKKFILKYKKFLDKELIMNNWIYKSSKDKKESVISIGKYECHKDYFIAYKAVKNNRYSKFNFQYQYLPNGVYESWCDCSNSDASFGLSAGTIDFCKNYADVTDIIVRVKIRYEDIGKIVYNGEKIRCFRFQVID